MKTSVLVGAVLIAGASTTFAARPSVYPLRSQNAQTQGMDNAYCYWQAKQQTGVDMARQSQRPVPSRTYRAAADAGRGASEPPLPAARGASDSGVSGVSGVQADKDAASGVVHDGASAASAQSIAARHAESPSASSGPGRANPSSSSGPRSASSAVAELPPLPPPEPPMTAYWHAYGDCMQSRGYGVQ